MKLGRALSRAGDLNLILVGFSSYTSLPMCQESMQVKVLSLSYLCHTVLRMLGHHNRVSEGLGSIIFASSNGGQRRRNRDETLSTGPIDKLTPDVAQGNFHLAWDR